MNGLAGNRVELRHLRVFEAVARLKSFTRAADELSITQPALSRTIQQLEDALGVALLDRSSRHVETTKAGQQFLDHVERVLAELERGFAAVRRQASIRLGSAGCCPTRGRRTPWHGSSGPPGRGSVWSAPTMRWPAYSKERSISPWCAGT